MLHAVIASKQLIMKVLTMLGRYLIDNGPTIYTIYVMCKLMQ